MLEKLDINLATPRLEKSALPSIILGAFFSIAVIYSVYNIYTHTVNTRRIAILKTIGLERGTVPVKRGQSPKELDELKQEIETVNDVIRKEDFYLSEFLTAIEETMPENVSMIQITPSFKGGSIGIKGMAKTMEDVFRFVEKLQRHKRFTSVFILKHSLEGAEGLPSAVFFDISSVYGGAGV